MVHYIRGLNEAISLARQCQSVILGVNVIPKEPFFPAGMYDSYVRYLKKDANKFLARAQKSAAQNGIELQEKILRGRPVDMINRFAKAAKCDIIVIGSRGKGKAKDEFFGCRTWGIAKLKDSCSCCKINRECRCRCHCVLVL